MWKRPHSLSRSARVTSGLTVSGSLIMPDSERLTMSTWAAWSSMERLRCSTPMPPLRAMAMAMSDSVTVSIAAEIAGTFIVMLRVRWVVVSTSDGMTSVSFGSSSTSS